MSNDIARPQDAAGGVAGQRHGPAGWMRQTSVFSAAELKAGDAFGEEALLLDNKRNATVTMKTDGTLLRLNKTDFIELLKAPLITKISMVDAEKNVQSGVLWLDVRFPSEYKFDHLQNALNAPLNEIHNLVSQLDSDKQYKK